MYIALQALKILIRLYKALKGLMSECKNLATAETETCMQIYNKISHLNSIVPAAWQNVSTYKMIRH